MLYEETIVIPLLEGTRAIPSYEEVKDALGDKVREYNIYPIPPKNFLGRSGVLARGNELYVKLQHEYKTKKGSLKLTLEEPVETFTDMMEMQISIPDRETNTEEIVYKGRYKENIEVRLPETYGTPLRTINNINLIPFKFKISHKGKKESHAGEPKVVEVNFSKEKTQSKEEKAEEYEYLIYSHINQKNPKKRGKVEVEQLRNLNSKEKGKQFDILLDMENYQLFVKGKAKKIAGKDIPVKFLALLLKNVASHCKFIDIGEEIWNDALVDSNLIHQTKHIISRLTEKVIDPYIEHGKTKAKEVVNINGIKEKIQSTEVYYIRKEDYEGHIFRYCLIISKD